MRQIITSKPGINKKGLIGWWKFNEGVGTAVIDYSGFGNNGTFVGTGNAWGAGGLTFNGSGWVDCGNGASLALTDQATMMAVIKYTASGATLYSRIIDKEAAYGLIVNSLNGMVRYLGGSVNVGVPDSSQLIVDTVVGITETCTDTLIVSYKNGILLGDSGVVTNAVATSANSLLMGNREDGTKGLIGTIYYALLYNRILSNKEIAQNHTAVKKELGSRGIIVS